MGVLLFKTISVLLPRNGLGQAIAMQLTTMAARATRAMQSAGRKGGPEAEPLAASAPKDQGHTTGGW